MATTRAPKPRRPGLKKTTRRKPRTLTIAEQLAGVEEVDTPHRRPGPKVMFPGKENKKKLTFSGPPYVRIHIEAASARLEMSMSDTMCAFIETYWKTVKAPRIEKSSAYRRRLIVAELLAGLGGDSDNRATPGAKSYYPGKDRARPISFTGPPYIRTHVDKAATREGMTPADLLCHIVETHWKVLKKPDKPKRMPAKRP